MELNEVLIRPIITEKGMKAVKEKTYLFEVNLKANKNQIKNAVEKIFGVKVAKVRVVIHKGKTKRVGRKLIEKKLPKKKIAYIKLEKGEIDIFPKT